MTALVDRSSASLPALELAAGASDLELLAAERRQRPARSLWPRRRTWIAASIAVGALAAALPGRDVPLAPAPAMLSLIATDGAQRLIGWAALRSTEPRAAFVRGQRGTIEVVELDDVLVEVNTARAFLAMRRAAALAGVTLEISSGFRTVEEQRRLYRAWRKKRGNRAARPGRSNHQSGRALDLIVLNDPAARAWLEANARHFGFKATVRGEPWHWEYVEAPRAAGPRVAKHHDRRKAKKAKAEARADKARPRSKRGKSRKASDRAGRAEPLVAAKSRPRHRD